MALDAVFGVVIAAVGAVVGGDMTVAVVGSGRERGGCRGCRGVVGWLGSECRRSRGAVRCFEAGAELVVVVVDNSVDAVDGVVGIADGGCVGVVGSDVAASRGVLGCSTKVWVAVSMVWGVAWMLKSTGAAAGVIWVSTLVVVTSSVWVSASSSRTTPQRGSHAWAAINRQSPALCPSVSHFCHSSSFLCCTPSL
jgi:hypothetical protein